MSLTTGTAHASPTDVLSPWGREVAISQENDLITSVNDSIVNKRVASLSAVRGINFDCFHFLGSFQVYFVASRVAMCDRPMLFSVFVSRSCAISLGFSL